MDAPERIWLQNVGNEDITTWCKDPVYEEDVEYVRANLVPPVAPDWRITAIAELDLAHENYISAKGRDPKDYTSSFSIAARAIAQLDAAK